MFRYQGNPLTKGIGWEFVNDEYELYASATSYNGRMVFKTWSVGPQMSFTVIHRTVSMTGAS
jgi:hypothetical protein